jgi:hypothetical protein
MADMHKNQWVPSPQPSSATTPGSASPLNREGIIFPSAVRTQTGGPASDGVYTSDPLFNANWKGVRLYLNRTVATGTVTFSVQGQDPVSGSWVAITGATTADLTSAIATTLTLYPGITAAAGTGTTSTEISTFLPTMWRVKAVVSTNTTTWSVGGEYLL